jgi:chromosomal replication initiation ATPase DnaA
MYKFMLPANYKITIISDNELKRNYQIEKVKKIIELFSLNKNNRRRRVVTQRQLLSWYIYENDLLPLQTIAYMLGYKNHGTILHSIKQANNLKDNKEFIDYTYSINEKCKEIFNNDKILM